MNPSESINVQLDYLIASLKRGRRKAVLLGVGLDIETRRSISPEAARFFLAGSELEWMKRSESVPPKTLLRLWTVKEAIFKADPENAQNLLGDYFIEDPSAWNGVAYRRDRKSLRFYYSSTVFDDGFLSIAVLAKGENDA